MALDLLPTHHNPSDPLQEDLHHQLLHIIECLTLFLDTLMAEQLSYDPTNIPKMAKWTEEETDSLVMYLLEHHLEAGDGSFKEATFLAAAKNLEPLHVAGKVKVVKSVWNKWNQVLYDFPLIYSTDKSFRSR